MAATNFTPIILYHTTTASAAPTAGNLNNGELAINITDGKLFYKDNGGTVQVIATKGTGTIGGSNTQVQYNSSGALAGSANFTFNGTTATINTLNLTNALGTAYGGTALTTYTQGDLVYASAANTLAKLGIGANTYILTSTGSVPQWSAPSAITVSTATNLAGGAAGSVPYQSGAGVTTFLSIGTANTVMTSSGTAPQWSSSLTLGGNLVVNGNTTLGDATADTVTVNALVNSNLLFTDNTYDIGASGANRPRNAYFSKVVYAGQTASDFQFLALDYGGASAGGIADGIYTSSIKAGTYQGFGFDTRYINAGSWASSTTTATIVDGYLGQFRVFTNSGLTAGSNYTPSLRFSIGSTGLAEFRTGATDNSIYNNIAVANESGSVAYGGYIGQRFVSSDQRQGMFVKGTGSLTLLAQYNIDFLAGQTAVPVAADTGLAMRITATGKVAIGNTSASAEGLLTIGSSTTTDKNGIVMNRGAVGSVSPTQVGLYNELNGIGSGETLTMRTPNGFKWQNNDGTSEWMRLVGSTGNLLLGTTTSVSKLTVSGDAFFGQISPRTRFTTIGNTGIPTVRYDDNGYGQIVLQNLGITAGAQGFRLSAQFSDDGTNAYDAGYIFFGTEGTYTSTASTRDSYLAFATVLNGTMSEKGRISSAGDWLIATTSNFGRLTVQTDSSNGSVGFIRNTDNAFTTALDFIKSRGSPASPTGVQNGDGLIQLRTAPYHGSGYTYLNMMAVEVDGTYTSGQNPPTRTIFYTNAANGAATGRMAILSGGQVIAGSTTGDSTLERFGVRGNGFMGISVNSDPSFGALPNQSGFMFTNNRSAGSVDAEIVYGRSDIAGTTFFRLTKNDAGTLSTQATMTNKGQWLVGTTQEFNDANSGTIYPGVVSVNGNAITPTVGSGAGSWICATKSYAINSSFTVRVTPSDGGYGLVDIRVGAYSSSGSGYANSYFAYGGHTGAYNITTVFNVNNGNLTVGAPTIVGGNIEFTVTIANTGFAGNAVFMVHDVGATAGKTARIQFV